MINSTNANIKLSKSQILAYLYFVNRGFLRGLYKKNSQSAQIKLKNKAATKPKQVKRVLACSN